MVGQSIVAPVLFWLICGWSRALRTKRRPSGKGRRRQLSSTGRRSWPRCLQCKRTSLNQTRCCMTTCLRVGHKNLWHLQSGEQSFRAPHVFHAWVEELHQITDPNSWLCLCLFLQYWHGAERALHSDRASQRVHSSWKGDANLHSLPGGAGGFTSSSSDGTDCMCPKIHSADTVSREDTG